MEPRSCSFSNNASLPCVGEGESPDKSPISQLVKADTIADSSFMWADASQTLIFLDWDDTLFPTTELFDNWGLSSRYETWDALKLSDEQEGILETWRAALFQYLKIACALTERCVVITNARRPWVSKCIDRFAPNLRCLFDQEDGPRIVYARETLARHCRGSPGCPRGTPVQYTNEDILADERDEQLKRAKFFAMRREARAFYSKYSTQTWKNILSVGDSKYEHNAAKDLAFRRKAPERECLRIKAIVTPVRPLLRDLIYRLKLSTLLWPVYVNFDGDLDCDMNSPDQLPAVADALGMPELRSRIRNFPICEEDEDALIDDFDELAVLVHDRLME